ncbi:MAG: aldehyde ferredoxin oxidoreductase N-terminal domain-containing protein [Thermodesulfobacteriota bacterium]|nr:aldehyde ferredoxin oxidoreductase N-terminal domain-containing protein [Thermodesulfobacteriota bacterium]
MTLGGFAGKILHVDLTSGEIRNEPLDPVLAEKYIGGLGLTVKLAYDAIMPGTGALSPGNPISLGAGPLVGTDLPSTSRVYAVTKLPTSGTIGWCGAGSVTFGFNLKNAGYDNIVITGKAGRPVYLYINDGQAEIREAGFLWGKSQEETCQVLWRDFAWPAGILAIGQAGENLVSFSMAYVNRIATLGRGGFGAVMGSKNLKAVVVRGSGGVKVADGKRYNALCEPFLETIREYPYLKEWQDLGIVKSLPIMSKETYYAIKRKRVSCVSCPIGCKDVVEIPDGKFKGLIACSSSAVNLWTPVTYGFKDYRESIKCIATIDGYGLDMFEFFGLMVFVKALCDEGIIPQDQVDPEIIIDSLDSMEAWAKKISFREGLGDILAQGFNGVLDEFGPEAAKFAPPLVKGMHPYAGPAAAVTWDLFGTMEIGQVLDPRGPHVGSGGSPTYFARRPLDVFPKHLKRMGVPKEAVARILPGLGSEEGEPGLKVGTLLKYSHAWFSTLGSMGICARAAINRFYSASLCADLYEAVTGIETDLPKLRERVDRVWTLFRMANVREGLNRKEKEVVPEQWFEKPMFKNYVTGEPLHPREAERIIEDYYDEWGWDRKTGIPTGRELEKLGLTGP